MSERQRLPLLAVIIVAAFSAHDPSAQGGDVMTPAPFAAALYAMPQGVVESACAAKCQQGYDRAMNIAADKVARKVYYAGLMSQDCPAPWQAKTTTNACVAAFFACDGKCGLYDDRCKAPCKLALQTCCNANDTANIAHERDVCLQTCSAAPAPAAGAVPPPPPPAIDSGTPRLDKMAEWTTMLTATTRMLEALGSGIEGWDLERLNNVRRSLAFTQVMATLGRDDGRFAMVSGGQGRIWIVMANGRQIPLSGDTAALLRTGMGGGSEVELVMKKLTDAGLNLEDAYTIYKNVSVYPMANPTHRFGEDFKPGDVWYFPTADGWSSEVRGARASSEHASIRGTINGGGDFI